MPITNGTISILRRVRTGDFEHIEPHVTISFTVDANQNEDAAIIANATRILVDEQYKHLLGIAVEPEKKKLRAKDVLGKDTPAPLSPSADAPVTTPTVAPVLPSAPVAGPVPPTAPPASAPVEPQPPQPASPVVPAAPGAVFNAAGQPASPTVPVAPPPAATVPATVAGPSTQTATAVVPPVAPALVVPAAGPTETATAGISDEMMAKRCQDKTDELNALYEPGVGLQKVVALIRQYINPPGRATQIPHENREAFLTNLSALA